MGFGVFQLSLRIKIASAIMGMLADLVGANRKLLETALVRLRAIEEMLVEPDRQESHEHRTQSKPAGKKAA